MIPYTLQEMRSFTESMAQAKEKGVILLITGDADFYDTARWCQQQGSVTLEVSCLQPARLVRVHQLNPLATKCRR
jgi:hypothetical protein